jgi:acetylornithine deacetylase/succinyl-diaminopimelate desuccinylase-like protein
MVALSQNPNDAAAEAIVSKDRSYHSMLRTTCVATLLEGGHANNALPQRAAANVNCRIFPARPWRIPRPRWRRRSAIPASR